MKVYYEVGDSLKADLILCEARKIGRSKLIIGSSRHRAQQVVIEENAFCTIRKKLRFLPQA